MLSLCSSRLEEVFSVVNSVSAAVPAPQQLGQRKREWGGQKEGREGWREEKEGGREQGEVKGEPE